MPEKAFHSILFPVDFSDSGRATAPHVSCIAEQTGAEVMLLHVVPWLCAWYGITELRPAVAGDSELTNVEQQAAIELQRFQKKYFPAVPTHREIQLGAVAETITERALNWGVDLIMMATRGLGRSRPFLIGSTAAKVLHDASCAVWASPHIGSAAPKPYKNILCTVDRDEIPHGYLEEATRLAACFGGQLTFVTAVPSYNGGFGEEHPLRHLTTEFPQARVRLCADPSDCSVITETGSVGEVIREVAGSRAMDLVVTNRGHLRQAGGRFVSHLYEIVLQSPCPVLSLCMCMGDNSQQQSEIDRGHPVGL